MVKWDSFYKCMVFEGYIAKYQIHMLDGVKLGEYIT